MLQKLNNFEELCLSFKWNIPEFYNIASDTVDQDIYQNRIALINFLQDGKIEEWSFVDIKRSANKLANVFDHFHLEANARVGIILGQCPETAIAHMACFKSGKISIPLFNLFGTDALHYRLLNSRASLVICDNIGLNKIFEIKDRLPDLKKIICIDSNDEKSNVFNLKKLLEQASDSYITKKTKSSDPAIIIYTSGTTGGPKGALLPHRSLLGHIPGVEIPHEFLSSSYPVKDLTGRIDAGKSKRSDGSTFLETFAVEAGSASFQVNINDKCRGDADMDTTGIEYGVGEVGRVYKSHKINWALEGAYRTGASKYDVNASTAICDDLNACLLYTSPSPRDQRGSRMPSSA